MNEWNRQIMQYNEFYDVKLQTWEIRECLTSSNHLKARCMPQQNGGRKEGSQSVRQRQLY